MMPSNIMSTKSFALRISQYFTSMSSLRLKATFDHTSLSCHITITILSSSRQVLVTLAWCSGTPLPLSSLRLSKYSTAFPPLWQRWGEYWDFSWDSPSWRYGMALKKLQPSLQKSSNNSMTTRNIFCDQEQHICQIYQHLSHKSTFD